MCRSLQSIISLSAAAVAVFLSACTLLAQHRPAVERTASASVPLNAESTVAYVLSCRKPNGAFGPFDQEYTDAAWNYPAVRTLQLLSRDIARPEAILEHGLGAPAGHAGLGHYHFFHHHGIRHALRSPVEVKHRRVAVVHRGVKPSYYGSPFGTSNDLLYKRPSGSQAEPHDLAGAT